MAYAAEFKHPIFRSV